MRLEAHGIAAELPRGWEGAITRQREPAPAGLRAFAADPTLPMSAFPSLHLGNFALPAARGDFGSRAVDRLTETGVFLALIEYGPECVGTPLFEQRGLPDELRPGHFSPRALQRRLPGQAGCQRFFSDGDRAFCLYVVLGSSRRAAPLTDEANRALRGVTIGAPS